MRYEIATTGDFDLRFDALRDDRAACAISRNIVRMSGGLFGNVDPVGGGVGELKVDIGAGCRIHFIARGRILIVLPAGGDRSSQTRDIRRAKMLASDL